MNALVLSVVAFGAVLAWMHPRGPVTAERRRPKDTDENGVPVAVVVGCAVLLVAAVVRWRSPTIALMGPWLGWLARRQHRVFSLRNEQRLFQNQLIEVVDAVVLHVRSGRSLVVAFQLSLADEGVAIVAKAFEPFGDMTRGGASIGASLGQLSTTSNDVGLRLLAATVSTLNASGGPAAASLERLNDTLRAQRSAAQESRAQASQAMASSVVMAGLPVVFGGVVASVEPTLADFYLRHPLGMLCVVASSALTAGGWFWIERVVGAVR